MKNYDFLGKKHIFFIGIGGISMSGLAKLALNFGCEVSGSDTQENNNTLKLKGLGVKIYNFHDSENITKDIDLVVYSSAIASDNPELLKAKSLGIKLMERCELLGLVTKNYQNIVAVSGTHGKTTTVSMIGYIFYKAGLNPTLHIGGEPVNFKENTIIGDKDFLILEACEYKDSFRYISADVSVITNIELEHVDYYKDISSLENAFQYFASNAKNLIVLQDVNIHHKNKITINKDLYALNVLFNNNGYDYSVFYKNKFLCNIRLNLLGLHNVENSLFAIAVALHYDIDIGVIVKALKEFAGVKRRYECIDNIDGVPIICDYAHHPTELQKSIDGILQLYKTPMIIFQPHTYSRTKELFDDFIKVLSKNKYIVIYKTYPAREEEIDGGRAIDLANHLRFLGNNNVEYFYDVDNLKKYIDKTIKSGSVDCVLVLGAGDLYDLLKTKK